MNIRELKRRLQPYSGYMKPAEDGGADSGGAAVEEKPDFGNDPDPEPSGAQADAADAGGAGGDGGDPPAGSATEAEGEEGADGQGGRRTVGIPKARFNEVNEEKKEALRKLQEAQEEIERLRTAANPAAAPAAAKAAQDAMDVDAKEEEYAEALYAGDGKKAAAIRREINAHLVDQATTRAREVAATEFTTRETKTLLKAAVDTTMAAYPWLNEPEGAEATSMIVAYRDKLHREGVPLHLALQQAAAKIAPKFAPDPDTPSRVSEKPAPAKDLRTPAAIARGTADADRQPPAVQAGIGNRATPNRIDWKALDDDQFAAVPKDELRKALGNA
ncbi:hypothetical protein LJR066_002836 [Acidovorax sp. LjRoot66]|uniref:hypothetical protein n=1 Tax=Acidovorax sp. LjRoot66 TaxID=3342334 RepID=UPI003ED02376